MKIELSQKALACLESVLVLPEWVKNDDPAKSIRLSYWANKLIAHLPERSKFPSPKGQTEADAEKFQQDIAAWSKKKAKAFEANAIQVETCKTAIKHAIAKGIVNNGEHMNELFEVFSLYEEEKP